MTYGIEITHRNLPHWHKDGCIQFVTFHLADSLPIYVRDEIEYEKKLFVGLHPKPWTAQVKKEYDSKFAGKCNQYLDTGYGSCCLRRAECAKIMEDALLFFNSERYLLHKYVIMPNHVHVLVELISGFTLSSINKSWKNYSALKINRILGRTGKLWHHESWDRIIRNQRHYDNVVNYINQNIINGGVLWMK